MVLEPRPGECWGKSLAVADVVPSVHVEQRPHRVEPFGEPPEGFVRPEMVSTLPVDPPVGFRAGEHQQFPTEQADLEHRPQFQVPGRQESGEVRSGLPGAPQDRQALDHGDLPEANLFPRGCRILPGIADGAGHRLPDQVHAPDQGDTVAHLFELGPGEDLLEHAAGIGQADEDDVARFGDVVPEQHAHDPQPHLLLSLAVHHGIPARPRHPVRQGHGALLRGSPGCVQDAGLHQPGQRRGADALAFPCDAAHPVLGVVRLPVLGNPRQRRVQQVVPERGRIEQDQLFGVRVDTVLQRQVHEHRAGQGVVQVRLGHRGQAADFLLQEQQEQFLGKPQRHVQAPSSNGR